MNRREQRRCRIGRKKEGMRGEKLINEDEHKIHKKRRGVKQTRGARGLSCWIDQIHF